MLYEDTWNKMWEKKTYETLEMMREIMVLESYNEKMRVGRPLIELPRIVKLLMEIQRGKTWMVWQRILLTGY